MSSGADSGRDQTVANGDSVDDTRPPDGSVRPDGPDSSAAAEGPPAIPVDWGFAERVAHRVAGHEPLADSYHRSSLETDFASLTARAGELVAEFTGLEPDVDTARGRVLDRQEWVSVNLVSFDRLLEPLAERFGGSKVSASPLGGVARRVAGAEAGALLGWFSRRVLGQYDLLGAGDGDSAGSVYYVGPNILGLEKRFGFRPREFRLWIALHEVTHLVQFTGVPWLREHFLGLVDRVLGAVDPDPRRLLDAVRRVVEDLREGRNPLEDGGLVALFAGEGQREALSEVQALMALLEGHGNFVMDRLGERHVDGQERMSRILRERRQTGGLAGQVQKVLGIEMKLRQYAVGEQFLASVEEEAGSDVLAALWEGPEALPSLEELRDPPRWVERATAVAV